MSDVCTTVDICFSCSLWQHVPLWDFEKLLSSFCLVAQKYRNKQEGLPVRQGLVLNLVPELCSLPWHCSHREGSLALPAAVP